MSASRLCLLLATTALLASCGGERTDEDDARSSSGEVLEGTISDSMLPLDTVRSQPPLLRRTPAAQASASDGGDEDAAEDGGADAANPEAGEAAPATAAPLEQAEGEAESEEGA